MGYFIRYMYIYIYIYRERERERERERAVIQQGMYRAHGGILSILPHFVRNFFKVSRKGIV